MSSIDFQHSLSNDFYTRNADLQGTRRSVPTVDTSFISANAWWTMLVCSVVALCTSSYLAWSSFTASPVAGCSGGNVFDCSHVLHTRWAKVASVPVSVPAILTHLTIIGLLFAKPLTAQFQRLRTMMIGFASLAAGAAAIWFIVLQFFVIRHLCPYCLVAHTAGLVLAGVYLWEHPVSFRTLRWLGSGAVVSLAVLAALQLSAEPPQTYEVIEYSAVSGAVNERMETDGTQGPRESNLNERPSSTSDTFAAPIGDDESLFAPPPSAQFQSSYNEAVRRFQPSALMQFAHLFLDPSRLLITQVTSNGAPPAKTVEVLGSVKLATKDWPLVGDPNAELIFVELFDYTCSHCQRTHKSLQGAKQKYGERLAVISLPVPLNSRCNPTVRTDNASHGEACEIAKLAIAVWTIDREKFTDFHDYLFESSPSYSQALAEAKTMLDADRLDAVLRSTLPSDYLERHVMLYQKAGSGQIPKLMFPKTTTVGAIETPDAMIRLIEQHLAN